MPEPSHTPEEPILRELRRNEAAELQAFYNGLSDEARRLFQPLGWTATLEQCEAICADARDGKRYDIVLDAGGRIVGWAFVAALDTDVGNFGVGISEEHVGRGYGGRLTRAVLDRARQLGKKGVELCHVVDNERAHRLYTSLGFKETGNFRGDDDLDYVSMMLTFDDRP